MLSVCTAETSGRKSRRLSRSSSCSLREMPRTGPLWMRFIRWVVNPAILFRRRCGHGNGERMDFAAECSTRRRGGVEWADLRKRPGDTPRGSSYTTKRVIVTATVPCHPPRDPMRVWCAGPLHSLWRLDGTAAARDPR